MSDVIERVEKLRNSMMKIMHKFQKNFELGDIESPESRFSISEMKTLFLFMQRSKYKMSEIAGETSVPLPTATHIIDRLVKDGIVERKLDEKDRRLVLVEITKKGKEMLDKFSHAHKEKMKQFFSMLDKEDQNKMINAMETFVTVLQNITDKLEKNMKKIGIFLAVIIVSAGICLADDITLDDSIKYAMEHNKSILSAAEKVKAAEGALTSASAALWPQISAVGSYSRSSYLTDLTGGGDVSKIPVLNSSGIPTGDYLPFSLSISSDREGDVYLGKLSLTYALFDWGRNGAIADVSYNNKLISDEDYKKTKNDVIFDIKSSFYGILTAKEFVRVYEGTKKSLEAHLKTVEERYQAGLSSKFEVLRARVQLSNIEPQLAKAQNQYELSVIAFNNTLGSGATDKYIAKGELGYEKNDFVLSACVEKALKNRSELKQLEYREVMANDSMTIGASLYKPMLNVSASYQANRGQQSPPNDTTWYTGWDAGASIVWPIFDGFNGFGKQAEAEANIKAVQLGKEQLVDGIKTEIKSAFLTLQTSEKTILSQKDNVDSAKESLKIVNERYKAGLATNLDVLDTEVSLVSAEINYLQALFDYTSAKDRLKKAMGTESDKVQEGGENVKQ